MDDSSPTVLEGWALKQKRRKGPGQGMARRWLKLQRGGRLSYFSVPSSSKPRDTCSVSSASIGLSQATKEMIIDTGVSVWKIQYLSSEDYHRWLQALRTSRAQFKQQQESRRQHKRQNSRQSFNKALQEESKHSQNTWLQGVQALEKPLSELESLIHSFLKDDATSSTHSESHNSSSKILGIFPRKPHHQTSSNKSDENLAATSIHFSEHKLKKMEKLVQDLRTRQQNLVQFGESSPTQFRRMSYDAGLGSISIPQSLYEEPQDFVPEDKHPEPDSDEESLLHRTESVYHDALTPQEYNIELGDEASTIKGDETHEEEPGSDEDGTEGSFSPSGSTSDLRTLQLTEQAKEVQRRTKLPTGVSGGQSSVFGILRSNVGKDLSRISMPVDFNEPMSALQKRCEELQYTALLREAAETDDEALRMAKVAAFIASGFATAKYRIQRKPFNPLLGETFECFRPDRGIVYFAEKAQHHPAVLLCSAHDPDHRWLYTGSIGAQEKFLGRSFEILPKETNRLKFPARDITVSWTKPSAYVRGLLAGERYIEYVGTLKVTSSTGWSVELEFKEGSSWGGASSRNKVSGKVKDSDGLNVACMQGRWDENITMNRDNDRETIVVWQIEEPTGDPKEYYGFTQFGIELNEITPNLESVLPPTDTRLRPDQRALEEGDVPKAEDLKSRLEEHQRRKRTQLEKESMLPEWFIKREDDDVWEFKRDEYLKARREHRWDERVKIFDI